jgi:DNA-binding transcriptional LysR family regulator
MIRQLTLMAAGIGVIDQTIAPDRVKSGQLVQVLPEWRLAPVPL